MAALPLILNGVQFAKATLPGYIPGRRVIVNASLSLSDAFQTAVDAAKGAAYSASVALTSVEYRLDDGTLLGTVSSPGSVTVTVGVLQEGAGSTGAGDGKRTVSAAIPDYRAGTPDYDGTAYCTVFVKVGTLDVPTPDAPAAPTSSPGGLLGRYYSNTSLIGEPVYSDPGGPYGYPNFSRQKDTPFIAGVVPDDFSCRFTGSIKIPAAGAYRFRLAHDDGARMWLDGRIAIDNWERASDDYSGTYTYALDQVVPIWIEHYDSGGAAFLSLKWATPSNPTTFVPIPTSVLYPTNGTEKPPSEAKAGIQSRHYVEAINRY